MNNLLIPQAFLQYRLLQSNSKTSQRPSVLTPSSFGSKPLQKTVPLAKLNGNYKPIGVVSKINVPSGHGKSYRLDRDFLNIENHKLSLLTPEIRLYRVDGDSYKPFYFPVTVDYNFTDSGRLDLTKPFSANSAVIQSFNIDYLGENLFEAGAGMLEAALTINLDSLSGLFEVPDDSYAQLADLIMMRVPESMRLPNSGKAPEVGSLESGRSLQIAATLGYSIQEKDGIFTEKEKSAIQDTKMLIHLFYKGRSLSYQQNGSVTINAQYHGNLQSVGQDHIFNIVEQPETKRKFLDNQTFYTKAVGYAIAPGAGKPTKDLKKDVPKKKEDKKSKQNKIDKKLNYLTSIVQELGKVVDNLIEKEKIHPVVFDAKSKGFFKFQGASTSDLKTSSVSTLHTAGTSQDDILAKDYIFYVNFGDLVDALAEKLLEKDFNEIQRNLQKDESDGNVTKQKHAAILKKIQKSKHFMSRVHVLFSNATIKAKGQEKEQTINLADVPVSMDILYSAVYEDFIKPRKYFLGLRELLEKFCTRILNSALDEYAGSDLINRVKVGASVIDGLDVKNRISNGKINVKDLNTNVTDALASEEKNRALYLIYQPLRTASSRAPGGAQKEADQNEGIIHLRPSQDRGLIKNITFSQQSVFGMEEYLIVGHGNSFDALRIPHNATVTMFGNNLFLPSMEVYVDPEPFGFGDPRGLNAAARRLGIGGYYTILKVSTAFNAGTLITTLQLQFASYPETRGEPKRPAAQEEARKEANDIRKGASALIKSKK